ncbi:TPA: hypothetical protein PKR15_000287 [Acinetobacter baumannii]|uniref:hypothetical protein n=1 Tax=Acinetobacter baumannii TaxID=470 RepID=UPI00112D9993|nr:hypothetical protein [Acinetobacter baumannii]MCT9255011.1 hypothetical protein [Acinetobacter baumannii]TPU96006.1 hypothetical protein FJV26_10495 [Acinetobacter baumannii]HDI1568743.1 hypothetical protein [Acinetobacter baumannii]HDI5712681.1 hypothetical protein [Acinetobacter baumannii]HDJ7836483.1 hypothetical protein [Acinetobacter baumannii]
MRSEFDTLEQYQESMKEFNENTRMGFEEFIQSHGSDRNKLQLRCTPYTSKKGGYGSFDLDFGLCVYKHQQSKVDELQQELNEYRSVAENLDDMYIREKQKNDELQKKNAWLSDVACRENKRANKLQEEKVSTTTLLGKTIQEKNELQKRVDAALKAIDSFKDYTGGDLDYTLLKIETILKEQALKGEGQ